MCNPSSRSHSTRDDVGVVDANACMTDPIKAKIIEAVPEIEHWCEICQQYRDSREGWCAVCENAKMHMDLPRPITLADVLRAMNEQWMTTATAHAISMQGDSIKTMTWRTANDTQIRQFFMLWNLTADYDGQTQEVKEFIGKLLGV